MLLSILSVHVHVPLFLGTSLKKHKFKVKITYTFQTIRVQHSVKHGVLACMELCPTTQMACSWSMPFFKGIEAWARGVSSKPGIVLLWGLHGVWREYKWSCGQRDRQGEVSLCILLRKFPQFRSVGTKNRGPIWVHVLSQAVRVQYLLQMRPWKNYLYSLCLRVLIYKKHKIRIAKALVQWWTFSKHTIRIRYYYINSRTSCSNTYWSCYSPGLR